MLSTNVAITDLQAMNWTSEMCHDWPVSHVCFFNTIFIFFILPVYMYMLL